MQGPARVVSALDRFVKIASVVVAVDTGQPVRLRLGQEIDPLVGLEMVFSPKISDPWR
jgi:hypothetical protein